jgi:hypothetical protein
MNTMHCSIDHADEIELTYQKAGSKRKGYDEHGTKDQEYDDLLVPNNNKRHRTEMAYHQRKINLELKLAKQRAKEGNRKMAYFYMEKAYDIAQDAGMSEDLITDKEVVESIIELGSERDFFIREMQKDLNLAQERAVAGNVRMMAYRIQEATQKAKHAGLYDATFKAKVESILIDRGSEKEYHIREMKLSLTQADNRATQGNRARMILWLEQATKHAQKAGLLDPTFRRQAQQIRSSLGCEVTFHQREMNRNFQLGEQNAKNGNRKMMEFRMAEARRHGKLARVAETMLQERTTKLRRYFCVEDDLASLLEKTV